MENNNSNNGNNNNRPKLYHGRKPVTRREFLASGAIPFMASMTMPSLMTMFAKSGLAQAQELCKAAAATKLAPFITVNLNGGWGATRNWIALTEGRELLPHYGLQGLGSAANLVGQIVKDGHFKNKPNFYSGSGFLAGVQTSLVPNLATSALAKTHFVGLPLQSQNDSDTNRFDSSGLVAKAGMKGKILPNMGRVDNGIGVSNATAFVMPPAPLIVNNVDNIINALGVADRLSGLSASQKTSFFKASAKLSQAQSRKLASMTGGSLLDRLLGTANKDNVNLIENPSGLDLDPRTNPAFAAVWGLNANTGRGDASYVNAALLFNAINGNAGTISIELGGYDYHGSDLATTNRMDTDAGVVIGRIIQSLHVMNSPGFIHLVSDGGVGTPKSDSPGVDPTADRGDAGAMFMMAYDPSETVESVDSQLGHMKNDPDAEAADDRFLVGGNSEIAAAAVFANYLSFNGKLGLWSGIPETNRTFDTLALDKIVKIHGKAAA
ncbi:MAG: hypothetical protein J0M15_14440 [Deltaproteobacteria bacterium]|nr:hypothetical protein [Deltaproteobacteria bacterium]